MKKLLIAVLILSSFSFASEICTFKSSPKFESKVEKFSFDKLEVYTVGIKMYGADKVQIDYSTFKIHAPSTKNNSVTLPLGDEVKKIIVSKSAAEILIPESKKILVPGNKIGTNKGTFDIRPRKINFVVGENGIKNIFIQNGIIYIN